MLAAPEALPATPSPIRDPFKSGWTPPPRRESFIAPVGEIAPPLPELDPAATHALGTHLDFDLDALEPEEESPAPASEPASEPSPETRIAPESDRGAETVLGWDVPASQPPSFAAPQAKLEPTFQPDATLVVTPLPSFSATSDPVTIVAPDRIAPAVVAEPAEPVFVSSFAGAEPNRTTDWESTSPGEPALFEEDETQFEAPEAVASDFVLPPVQPAQTPPPLPPFSALDSDVAHPYSWEVEHEAQPMRWPWILGILVLSLAGAAQGLLLMRHDIAQQIPALRPVFEASCAKLGCAMPWPRVKEQISLEASDLHPRPGHLGQYELSATLRNRAGFAQAYPHLEVTLTDNFNRALVRKVLPPEQWLPAAQRKTPAFEASSDLAFTITFEAMGQSAAGYTLSSFYP
ncbi:DUF3426 domain-containing protein [Niveibacterium terrae]|uniref:DUF3426 domain-containing protein n=1 Tax=Niveibacterium terrae TaxID=3373598 RepID=UPI003A940C13